MATRQSLSIPISTSFELQRNACTYVHTRHYRPLFAHTQLPWRPEHHLPPEPVVVGRDHPRRRPEARHPRPPFVGSQLLRQRRWPAHPRPPPDCGDHVGWCSTWCTASRPPCWDPRPRRRWWRRRSSSRSCSATRARGPPSATRPADRVRGVPRGEARTPLPPLWQDARDAGRSRGVLGGAGARGAAGARPVPHTGGGTRCTRDATCSSEFGGRCSATPSVT
jgi:hypothetical protein